MLRAPSHPYQWVLRPAPSRIPFGCIERLDAPPEALELTIRDGEHAWSFPTVGEWDAPSRSLTLVAFTPFGTRALLLRATPSERVIDVSPAAGMTLRDELLAAILELGYAGSATAVHWSADGCTARERVENEGVRFGTGARGIFLTVERERSSVRVEGTEISATFERPPASPR